MAKKYFRDDEGEYCFTIDSIKEQMISEGISELEVFEAERTTDINYFFCKEFLEVGEKNEGCGKECSSYIPNNGKNGRCKHYGYLYEPTDKKRKIKISNNENLH